MGCQVTYLDREKRDNVTQHGQRIGDSILLVDLPLEQYLSQVDVWSSDKVYCLYFTSSDGKSYYAGNLFGSVRKLQKPIFGFYGGLRDGSLVSLGFYTLLDLAAARDKTAMVGGADLTVPTETWDDTKSYNGASLSIPCLIFTFYCTLSALHRPL